MFLINFLIISRNVKLFLQRAKNRNYPFKNLSLMISLLIRSCTIFSIVSFCCILLSNSIHLLMLFIRPLLVSWLLSHKLRFFSHLFYDQLIKKILFPPCLNNLLFSMKLNRETLFYHFSHHLLNIESNMQKITSTF